MHGFLRLNKEKENIRILMVATLILFSEKFLFMTVYTECCEFFVLSCAQLFATLWTVDCQAPLSIEFSRQEYWSGLPFPTPRDLPNPGIKPVFLVSPTLAGGFFTTSITWVIQ